MTITTQFNSMIYTIVITIQLTAYPTLYVQGQPDTSDPPGISISPLLDSNPSTLDKNSSSQLLSNNSQENLVNSSVSSLPLNSSAEYQGSPKLLSPSYVLDNLRTLITDPSSGALVHHRNRRSAHHSSHTPSEGHRKHPKSSTRKKYDWRRDPPPYMWTTDPTRETVRLWSTDGPNPFSFVVYKFDTRERIENYKREMWIMKNRPEDTNLTGPVPLRHPNGTRIKVKRKYSWLGDDPVSNETLFHRKVARQIEEYIIGNESVSSDESVTPGSMEFTKRMRIRTRAKYKGWTYYTTRPNVSWSPDVYVNSPHSDIFYSSEFGPAGSDTIEEYYANSAPKPDYNDSIYHLPDDLTDIPDKPRYREIASRTPPRESEYFYTVKSHYDSHELYNDISVVTKNRPKTPK
ncbi:hypothetical protein M8J76_014356 [Diaphorina citri]|nr:hypothetical protein M8J76_014356 [Diaphorina citri]KAI5721379.1 hypothetical protein M8J77_020067 [Diaphorina citri]